jgi:hypothetical protein
VCINAYERREKLALAINDEEKGTVITATEARQGRITGLIWVLIFGLVLAVIAGAVFLFLGNA